MESEENGWKVPSLVATSLDAGLRPIEVARACVQWVDAANDVLRVPKEDSSKNRENWVVSLQSRTSQMLARRVDERQAYPDYEETDQLHGKPQNQFLFHILKLESQRYRKRWRSPSDGGPLMYCNPSAVIWYLPRSTFSTKPRCFSSVNLAPRQSIDGAMSLSVCQLFFLLGSTRIANGREEHIVNSPQDSPVY